MLCGWDLGFALIGAEASASVPNGTANPYKHIAARNVFQLTSREPEPITPKPIPAIPEVRLVGIITGFPDKRALLKLRSAGHSKTDSERSLILSEGQRTEGIEVLQVDKQAASVRIKNAGAEMLLTFDNAGTGKR